MELAPKILYEDNDVCVIDKPAGAMVHEDGVSVGETMVDWRTARKLFDDFSIHF